MKKKNWSEKLKTWLNMDNNHNVIYGCIDEIGFSWRCENCKDFQCKNRNISTLKKVQ